MSFRYRPRARNVVLAVLLLLAVGWIAPQFFNAERYRKSVQQGLERALGRSATFGTITFHLLPRPGFTLENVVIGEDPDFGAEPFARVDRMDCDFRLRSLLPWRLDILSLSLERPSFNLVRNSAGKWNVENLLGSVPRNTQAARSAKLGFAGFQLEASDARLNFKLEDEKKPFAVDNVEARLDLDPSRGKVDFQITGEPVRTDLLLPTPGDLQFEGQWMPGGNQGGSLDATLSTHGAMLYDWIPLLTHHNPGIYGVVEGSAHLGGSVFDPAVEGRIRIAQLHRWDQPPPSGNLDAMIYFRGRYNRTQARLSIESVDASFADSHVHLTGSVDDLRTTPVLDLVLAVERSHLEDFRALAGRFESRLGDWSATGRVDALMTIQGPWNERRYGGFFQIRDVQLSTPSGKFQVSDVSARVDHGRVRLAPVRVTLAPRMELVVDGLIERPKPRAKLRRSRPALPHESLLPYQYLLTLTARSVPLGDLLRFARAIGFRGAGSVDARGGASGVFTLSGSAWPPAAPEIAGRADLQGARLFIPGLTESLNLPRAHIQFENRTLVISPIIAVLGTSVFTGRIEHQGALREPWNFDLHANALRLEQGALWFDVLGNRQPLGLLARLPGLRSLVERRSAASNIFTALRASGHFSTPRLIYRDLTLHDFRAGVEIGNRAIHVNGATFALGGGRGTARLLVDLTQSPARIVGDAALEDARLQPLEPLLPPDLQKTRGSYSLEVRVATLGLTRREMIANLQAAGEARLKNVDFGAFDPLAALARASRQNYFETPRGGTSFHSAVVTFRAADGRVNFASAPVAFSGAQVKMDGTYEFGGITRVNFVADLRGAARGPQAENDPFLVSQRIRLRLTGPLNKLTPEPVQEVSKAAQ
jgi:AsmA family